MIDLNTFAGKKKMSLKLTVEQIEKLRKLDEEMKRRIERKEKNRITHEASSLATGIPINIVDMDVIKIGTLLGIIKKKSILEGKEPNTGSLLNILLGSGNDFNIDRSNIPVGFKNAPDIYSEADKISHHQEYVQKQCEYFSNMTMQMITQEIKNISKCFAFNLETATLENFKTSCYDTVDTILDEICDDDDDELWNSLKITRNALLGVVNICEYKKILNHNIIRLTNAGKSYTRILKNLSVNDVRLILCRKSLTQIKGPLTYEDSNRLIREIEIRSYMKPPELKVFNFNDIIKHCCIPSLMCVPLNIVIEHGLVGPYRNNSIGYLMLDSKSPWSFYNLKCINEDGSRLWVLDNKLWMFTENMITALTTYMIKIFRIFYYEYYGSNKFSYGFWIASLNYHYDAFINIMYNITFISNHSLFNQFLITVIKNKSCLIPTEYDFFNHIRHYDYPVLYKEYFEENMKLMFDDIIVEDLNKLKKIFKDNK